MFRHLLALLCFVPALVAAASLQPYDPGKFTTLTQDGRVVVLAFGAGWCPTCQAQQDNIETLLLEDEFKDMQVLTVDISEQKDVAQHFQVVREASLVLFRGQIEVARSWLAVSTYQLRRFLQQAKD